MPKATNGKKATNELALSGASLNELSLPDDAFKAPIPAMPEGVKTSGSPYIWFYTNQTSQDSTTYQAANGCINGSPTTGQAFVIKGDDSFELEDGSLVFSMLEFLCYAVKGADGLSIVAASAEKPPTKMYTLPSGETRKWGMYGCAAVLVVTPDGQNASLAFMRTTPGRMDAITKLYEALQFAVDENFLAKHPHLNKIGDPRLRVAVQGRPTSATHNGNTWTSFKGSVVPMPADAAIINAVAGVISSPDYKAQYEEVAQKFIAERGEFLKHESAYGEWPEDLA